MNGENVYDDEILEITPGSLHVLDSWGFSDVVTRLFVDTLE